MKTSDHLQVGRVYTREDLKAKFGITDATINTGCFQPKGHDSVWLFLTEKKSPDRTQYQDQLVGDELYMEGQTARRTDPLIIEHAQRGLELLLFHRDEKYEFEGAGFRYEGTFRYAEHTDGGEGKPTRFHLVREQTVDERRPHRSFWAIVANPDVYRIEDAIVERDSDLWIAKRGDIHVGDRVVIWKAKGSSEHRGVIAAGDVVSEPELREEEPEALPYWRSGDLDGPQRRIRVRYVRPPRLPLWLNDDATGVLAALSVSRATGGGVYRIEPDQWEHLVEALGGWPEDEVAEQEAVIEAVRTAKAKARSGQGFSVSPEVRKVIELHAMRLAEEHYRAEGFNVEVRGKPYDLRCTNKQNDRDVIYVEVKGTTSAGEEILLTPNEVRFARDHARQMVLFVASGVTVGQGADGPTVVGGDITILRPWNVDDGTLTPVGYSYVVPR